MSKKETPRLSAVRWYIGDTEEDALVGVFADEEAMESALLFTSVEEYLDADAEYHSTIRDATDTVYLITNLAELMLIWLEASGTSEHTFDGTSWDDGFIYHPEPGLCLVYRPFWLPYKDYFKYFQKA